MKKNPPMAEAGTGLEADAASRTKAALKTAGVFAGRFRWMICALLFLGVTKNYMDRQVLGVLKGPLQHEFGWNEIDYGNVVFAFQTAYALGMVFVGGLIDRLGTRIGYAAVMVFWSVASMAHAIAGSLGGFMAARGTGIRGSRRVSREHQMRCGMVSEKRAGAVHGNFQCGHQRGSHGDAAVHSVDGG